MSRCIIIGAHMTGRVRDLVNVRPDDCVLCADGGYAFAQDECIVPELVIGDFDSQPGGVPEGVAVLRVPAEKDDTDMMLCVKHGLSLGHDEFILLGALGGRMDHTVANLQVAAYLCERSCFVLLAEEHNLVSLMGPGTARIPRVEGYKLSVLAYTAECTGVSETGVKWPLDRVVMKSDFPLGISNEFTEDTATVTCETGMLLVMLCRDAGARSSDSP